MLTVPGARTAELKNVMMPNIVPVAAVVEAVAADFPVAAVATRLPLAVVAFRLREPSAAAEQEFTTGLVLAQAAAEPDLFPETLVYLESMLLQIPEAPEEMVPPILSLRI